MQEWFKHVLDLHVDTRTSEAGCTGVLAPRAALNNVPSTHSSFALLFVFKTTRIVHLTWALKQF